MAIGTPSDRLQGSSPGASSTKDMGSSTKEMKGTAQDMTQAAKEQAGAAWSDAKETARSKLNEGQRGAATSLGDFAHALRRAAGDMEGDRQGAARMANWTADCLDRVSSTLRTKDVDSMLREVNRFARNQPVAFFGAALAAGFLATRFLKASNREDEGMAARGSSASPDFTSTTRM